MFIIRTFLSIFLYFLNRTNYKLLSNYGCWMEKVSLLSQHGCKINTYKSRLFQSIIICRHNNNVYRIITQTMSNNKRLLIYIIPVTTISFALNIPKFMDIEMRETNGTTIADASETRLNPTYIFYYTLSLIWHPTLTTGNC